MTHAITYPAPLFADPARPNEEGPVVLATKPFDGSDAPLAVARWLAHREDRELHVISVLEQHDAIATAAGAPPLPARYYDEERSSIAARMRESLAADVTSGVTYRVEVQDGVCAESVVRTARDRGARVIVVGTGRHDSLGRLLYGERALQIVRIADRPVLVVPRNATSGTIHRAVVAVDFTPVSLRAARALIPMLSAGSTLTLVHVKPAVATPEGHPGNGRGAKEARTDSLFRRFEKLLAIPPAVTLETRVLWGDAAVALQQFATVSRADLVACGRRRSHSLLERMLVGSVSAALVRTVACPVLVVPELPEDDVAELNILLSGTDAWEKHGWNGLLDAFSYRNRDRQVRLGTDGGMGGGGQCVAQDYLLRALTFNVRENVLTILLADSLRTDNLLAMKYGDVQSITSFSDVSGSDVRLVVETTTARCTLTFTPPDGSREQ